MGILAETDSGSALNITTEQAVGEFTAPYPMMLGAQLRLSGLNAAAANLTIGLRLKSAAGAMIADYVWTQPKRTATDTVFGADAEPIYVAAGEKVEWRVLSSNAGDTNVTWSINWLRRQVR